MNGLFDPIAAVGDRAACAFTSPEGALTYEELLERSRRLGNALRGRDSPVLLYGHKEPAMIVGLVAALRVCRPYIPVDVSAPPARIARMIELARPRDAVLARAAPAELTAALAAQGVDVVGLDPLGATVGGDTSDRPDVDDRDRQEDPAYVLFTSGTTGDPKGVPIPRRALAHFVRWLTGAHDLRAGGEVFLNQAPFSFDLSAMDLYGALWSGGTLFALSSAEIDDARRLFERLEGAPLTAWVSTPSFAQLCLAEPRFDGSMLPRLRRFLFCGETLPTRLARELLRRFPRAEVWNTYGPTETTVAVTGVRIDAATVRTDDPLPIGRPFPGMDVWIADPADPARRLVAGEPGEILVAGPQVGLGYLGAAGSSGGFVTLPDGRPAYRTGDVGRLDPRSGLLYCGGRLDRQVKLHGYRLELEEIEVCLRAVSGIHDAAVLVVERGGTPDHLVAFVVADASAPTALPLDDLALRRAVRGALAARLPRYSLPRAVRRVGSLPLSANGKVDRRALLEALR